ncbi:MAG TPA: MFS transporter [Nitrospirales bacterium]|nr:MFS transporter [Nitrospirales bacterium]
MTVARSYLLLCAIGTACFISYNLVRMPVLALFAQSLGAGPQAIGIVVAVSTLTGVLLKLPSGALSDLYGRRLIMRIGVLAFAIPPFAYPFIADIGTLTALRFVHGLATAVFAPTALATVADLYRERRGAAMGTYTASTQAGALLGPVIGGTLVYAAGFPTTFVTAGVFGTIGAVMLYLLALPADAHRPERPEAVGVAVRELWKGLVAVARNVGVVMTSAADAAKMIANGALMAFLPIYGLSVGLNPSEVGLLFGVQGVTSLFAKPLMGRVSDRIGRRPLILAGLLICAGTFASIASVSAFPSLLLLAAGFGFGEAVVSSSTAALVADLSAVSAVGAGMGMQGMIMDIGHASGPLLAGLLIGAFSYQTAFAVIAVLQLIAAGLFWSLVRSDRPVAVRAPVL